MSQGFAVLNSQNLSCAAFMQQPAAWQAQVLGAICFSATPCEPAGNAPHIDIAMPVLDYMQATPVTSAHTAAMCEVWLSAAKLTSDQSGDIRYRHDDSLLFGVVQLDEQDAESALASPLQSTTERAYRQIFALLDALDFPFVYRFWNYMADINGHSDNLERYRQFNLGRQDAFMASKRDVAGNVPAACALGAANGPLSIAFLAGRMPALAIENPRQLSAYDYPQDYGPRSPIFSRASLIRMDTHAILFISGTASIVGHATVHPTDVQAQTRETLANIEAIVQAANRESRYASITLGNLFYRVYVRHAADLPAIQAVMQTQIGTSFDAVFLQADVCRQDLLVEIEASASVPTA